MVRCREGRGTDSRHLDARRGHRPRRGAHPPLRRRFGGTNPPGRDANAKRRGVAEASERDEHESPSERTRWAIVMAFAIAMAWVEAASVFYIRALVDRIEPYQADPLPMNGALGNVELWREAATLVMIATLGAARGANVASPRRLRGAGVRRLGHLLLRLPSPHLRLAEDAAGLGHPVPAAASMVGAGARAGQYRAGDDPVGHARDAVG